MGLIAIGLVIVLAVLVGRNDAATLVALATRLLRHRLWWPSAVLGAAIVVAPVLAHTDEDGDG